MRVTLRKVAKETGYSVAAISQVLNDHPNAQTLRSETRKKILEAVQALGYRRNANAVQIRTGVCKTVALIANFETFEYNTCISLVMAGSLLAASEEGYGVKVYDTSRLEQNFDDILRHGIDYVLVFSFNKEIQKKVGDFCKKNTLSLCYLQESSYPGFPVIYSDDRKSICDLITYFHEKGHRRLAFISSEDDTFYALQRRLGFVDGIKANGLKLEPKFMSCRQDMSDNRCDIESMLKMPDNRRPTAFICSDDSRAMLFENLALKLGIKIPEDCVVSGYGNTISHLLHVPASTVAQPFHEIGMLGLKIVIGKPDITYEVEPNLYLLPTEFVERNSTRSISNDDDE
jgi:LacI family transcriptional regulator